jgi:hypothetical protein
MQKCTLPYRERRVRPIAYYVNREMPPEMQDHVVVPRRRGRRPTACPPTRTRPTPSPAARPRRSSNSWNLALMPPSPTPARWSAAAPAATRDACHASTSTTAWCRRRRAFLGPQPKARQRPRGGHLPQPRAPSDDPRVPRAGLPRPHRRPALQPHHLLAGQHPRALRRHRPLGLRPAHRRGGLQRRLQHGPLRGGRRRPAARLRAHGPRRARASTTTSNGAAAERFARNLRNPAGELNQAYSDAELASASAPSTTANLASQQRLPRRRPTNREASAAAREPRAGALRTARPRVGREHPHRASAFGPLPAAPQHAPRGRHDRRALARQPRLRPQRRAQRRPSSTRSRPCAAWTPRWPSRRWTGLMQRLEARGFCFQDAGAPPVVGSRTFRASPGGSSQRYRDLAPEARARRIFHDLRIEAYKGIALHEIGHSLGLYHVPVSSYDAMNYNPQYWQLRTRNGQATSTCTPVCNANNCAQRSQHRPQQRQLPRAALHRPALDDELGVDDRPAAPRVGMDYFGNTSVDGVPVGALRRDRGHRRLRPLRHGHPLRPRARDPWSPTPPAAASTPADQARFSARLRTSSPSSTRSVARPGARVEEGVLPIHYTELARQMRIFDPSRCRPATARGAGALPLARGRRAALQLRAPRDHAALTDFETDAPPAATSDRVAPRCGAPRADARTGAERPPLELPRRLGHRHRLSPHQLLRPGRGHLRGDAVDGARSTS